MTAAMASVAPAAQASPGQFTLFDASEELSGSLSPGLTASALDDADALGADAIRVLFYWRDVVATPDATSKPAGDSGDPAWPGYAQPTPGNLRNGWGKYDEVIKAIVARGMQAVLVPTGKFPEGRVPRWASNSPFKDGTDPDPGQYGLFLKALGRRYRGGYNPGPGLAALPGASAVGVWNEINSPFQFQPQVKNGSTYGPTAYRALYSAGRQGLLDGGFQGQIWMAELAPRGTGTTLGALEFTKQFLCLQAVKGPKRGKKGKKRKRKVTYKARCPALQADAFAHHPHSGIDVPFKVPFTFKTESTMGNLADLVSLVNKAAAAGAINPMPVVLSEYGVQTNPPDPFFGRSPQEQAEYLAIAEYLAYRNKSVTGWSQYLMRDDADTGGFQSGLRYRDGTFKPAFEGFRMPLVIRKTRGKCVRYSKKGHLCIKRVPPGFVKAWGGVRPTGSAVVQIERSDGGAFTPATPPFNTDALGYFTRKLGYRKGRVFRIVWSDAQDGFNACSGSCVGPPIRAYKFQ